MAAQGARSRCGSSTGALSRFIADFAAEVGEVEINPFAVFEEGKGCLALDCVIVAKEGPVR